MASSGVARKKSSSSSSQGSGGRQSAGSTKSAGRVAKPSDKLNPKTIDPFSNSTKNQSAFAAIYSNGGIPCRLTHGSVRHKLAWDTPPEQVQFDPVLVTLAEGLKETVHPYTFVARTGFKELLEVPGCANKVIPLLPKLSVAIRGAIGHTDPTVVTGGLDAVAQLSEVVGPALNAHINKLLVPVSKHMTDKRHKEKVVDTLNILENNGGRECLPMIKSKVPTYCSIFT
ncbi:PACRG-like protein [Ruditapes philippinarum]|uniref:PACRG-like protein n=1 Tax=Ruditapes philippinarum TaxID=129788 RepID=UPI00295BA2FC|nr:PACRG-like protein [Ruditapes philippinarum]